MTTRRAIFRFKVRDNRAPKMILGACWGAREITRHSSTSLHREFSSPTPEKLLKQLICAGEPWNNDEEIKLHIQKVSEKRKIYQVYQKPLPRPVVGLSLELSFHECVAM